MSTTPRKANASAPEEKKSIENLLKYGKDFTALAENNAFGIIS